MTPDADVDVVVIGFGMAGATAALSAASTGARVLALDAGSPGPRRDPLRAAARAEGVQLRAPYRVHELVTEAGRVRGVGYATLPPGSLARARHQLLRRMSGRAGAGWCGRAAESVWASRFVVGEIRCSAVVLAIDSRHWDFVGTATWSAARTAPASRTPGWLSAVPAAFPPTPELAARRWLAARAGSWWTPRMGELRVDALTGAVLVDEDHVVPGLYSAVPVAGDAGRDAASLAGRAGYGAVIMTQSWADQGLSSVG